MFKKPLKIKSNSQLKGTELKKLLCEITQQFPKLSEEALYLLIPKKESVFQLKTVLQCEENVTIYCVQKLPILFQIEKNMYPTVFMLWKIPDLLYSFTTWPEVLPIIARGADLMLPGVVLPYEGLHAYGRLQKGERVAINVTTNKAPIAVGTAANSSYDMFMCGKQGKCVQVLHYYGDYLSKCGRTMVVPELGPAVRSLANKLNDNDFSSIDKNEQPDRKKTEVNSEKEDFVCNNEPKQPNQVGIIPTDSTLLLTENSEHDKENNVPVMESLKNTNDSTFLMDELLKYCFFKSLKTTMKEVKIPLLISNFYKLHMINTCPEGKILDIKKSSYKKLSNFLDEMEKLNVVKIESFQKGVKSITKINYSSDFLKEFVDNLTNRGGDTVLPQQATVIKELSVPEIRESYTITELVLPLFKEHGYKNKEPVTAAEVREVVSNYVKVNNLQNSTNKKEAVLDELLRRATKSPIDVTVLPWHQLMSNVLQQMQQLHKVELRGCKMPLVKGKLQPVDIQVGTRSGNKKVTLVNNLEFYGINLAEFSKECQHGVAASTTINSLPSAKSLQLQIQGNQVEFIGKLLIEKYKIPKTCLRGLENAMKKKRQ